MFGDIKKKAQEKYDKVTKKGQKQEGGVQDEKYKEMEEEEEKAPQQLNQDDPNQNIDPKRKMSTTDQIKGHLNKGANFITSKVTAAKEQTQAKFRDVNQNIKNGIIKQKADLNNWIAIKADEKVVQTMGRMEPKLDRMVDDTKMPRCLKNFVLDITQHLWHDVTDMVRFELRIKLQEPKLELSKRPDKYICLYPWYKLRNWYLYTVCPYDKTFWEQTRMPSWYFWKILQAIPHYGIQASVFFLLFLCIDKSEEFQLVNFILNYKTMQFLTAGCMGAIIGYFQYLYCATIQPSIEAKQDFMNEEHRALQSQTDPYSVLDMNYCFQDGPGTGMNLTVSFVSFFVQVFLIWCSYFLLYCSKSRLDFIDDQMKITNKQRGGRLKSFMIYDLIVFCMAVGLTLLLYFNIYYIPGQPAKLYTEVAGIFYFAKVFYGICSLPFLIFAIDFFVTMFTTSKPTAYDQYGNVVPVESKIKLVYSELPPEDEKPIDIEEAIQDDGKDNQNQLSK